MSTLENLEFTPGTAPAQVIVNARTGTVVIGDRVRITPAAVTHGSLTVSISERANVSQPGPLAQGGQTAVTPESTVQTEQEVNPMFVFDAGVTLNQLVRAVNEVGATPSDLIAILEALQRSGALEGELVII
jgi:flagellar P-ring protein precursor FlgI